MRQIYYACITYLKKKKKINLTFNPYFWISNFAILWQRKLFRKKMEKRKKRSVFNENTNKFWV